MNIREANKYDVVVVGSGFSGSIMARELAEREGARVLVVERRGHIAGNMYDEPDEHGILIQKYGPHFVNTDKYWIIKYLKRFAEMVPYEVHLTSFLDGRFVTLPWSFRSVRDMLGDEAAEPVLAALRREFGGRDRVPIFELIKANDSVARKFAQALYEKAFVTYTAKMWDTPIEEMDPSVAGRVPVAMGYDPRYLNKDFQYLPKDGFTCLFERMLDHPLIDVETGVDAIDDIELLDGDVLFRGSRPRLLVFTGAIDELFRGRYGWLPYRSLDLQVRYENWPALPTDCVSYPQAPGYVRDTEYRRFTFSKVEGDKSVVVREFPIPYARGSEKGGEPFYPVINDANRALYERYRSDAEPYRNLLLCGRLAEYRYFNMDLVIESTFEKLERAREVYQTAR